MQYYDDKESIAESRGIQTSITGTGAAHPTKRYGQGMTITRQASGVYRYSFQEAPGYFVAIRGAVLRADTMSAVKGYSLSAGVYVAPSGTTLGYIDVSVWDASNNAVDLAALQYLDVTFCITGSSAAG